MRAIGQKNTKPELIVRRLLYQHGYRYRLHRKDLPGCPDLVFPGRRAVIFVHGCFWHGHECSVGHRPKSNQSYWNAKIEKNKARDKKKSEALTNLGWRVIEVWECETRTPLDLEAKLKDFLR
jgi:DNA mismatch endonuclease (patch repair protein)